jgi:hypothetical protein
VALLPEPALPLGCVFTLSFASAASGRSLRILDVPEGEAVTACTAAAVPSPDHSTNLRSKSTLGCLKQGLATSKGSSILTSTTGPHLCQPPLSTNSTALKWDGPVPEGTRSAVAGLLAELAMLPHLAATASARLAASRLATLLTDRGAAAPG